VPTPESAAAFANLVEARTRLTGITKQLNEAHAKRFASPELAQQYFQLQKLWDEAFKNLETATAEFAAVIHQIHPPE